MTKKLILTLLILIALSGCLGNSTVKDTKTVNSTPIITPMTTPNQKVDLSKIEVTFGVNDFDVYINGEGGKFNAISQVTVRNNNDLPISVKLISSDRSDMTNNNVNRYHSDIVNIDAFTSKVLESQWGASISPPTNAGTYYGALELRVYNEDDLIKANDELAKELSKTPLDKGYLDVYQRYGKVRAETPVVLRVHDFIRK